MNFSGISSKGLIGRLLRSPLRLIPPSAVMPILQGSLKGKKWVTGSSTHGCWLGSYEFDKQQLFSKYVHEGQVVFDIGAHVGFYTLLSSVLVGSQGHVFAFEPFPPNRKFLQRHIELNQIANVTVIDKAVSSEAGKAAFEVAHSSSMGHLSSDNSATSTIMVETVVLDDLVRTGEVPIPDVMKIDVEGAEYAVLEGARSLLSSPNVTIFLATHGNQVHRKCIELLQELGYKLTSLDNASLESTSEVLAVREN